MFKKLAVLFLLICSAPAAFAACVVDTVPLTWGNIGLLTRNYDTVGSIRVQCDATTPYTIKTGNPGAATWRLSKGASWIEYRMYSDPARTLSIPVNGTIGSGVATGAVDTHSLYGRIPAGTMNNSVSAGSYSGNVPILVEY